MYVARSKESETVAFYREFLVQEVSGPVATERHAAEITRSTLVSPYRLITRINTHNARWERHTLLELTVS